MDLQVLQVLSIRITRHSNCFHRLGLVINSLQTVTLLYYRGYCYFTYKFHGYDSVNLSKLNVIISSSVLVFTGISTICDQDYHFSDICGWCAQVHVIISRQETTFHQKVWISRWSIFDQLATHCNIRVDTVA